MKEQIMSWQTCKNEHIKKVEPDQEKIKSIIRMCDVRLKVIKQIKLNESNAFILSEGYYEIIKELLTALMLKEGLKSDNHGCLIAFFKEKHTNYLYEAQIIYQLKQVRNKITYEGFFVKKDYIERNKLEFEHIIKILNGKP